MKARTITRTAMLTALAMALSYMESLLPAFTAIPGIKVGLANIAVVFALYSLGASHAVGISLLRVGLMSLLFGQTVGWFFSLLGALFSLCVMIPLRRLTPLSPIGVSVAGGVAHNIGQTVAAMLVMGTTAVAYYLPVLLLSGTIAGVVVGFVGGYLMRRLAVYVGNSNEKVNKHSHKLQKERERSMSIAIITGASSGIGREFARQLKETLGITEFWFIARRREPMEALAKELGVNARILCADLCTTEGIAAVEEALAEEHPSVRWFVSAAGFGRFGTFDQLSATEVARMIDLNVKASVLLTHAVIPYMEQGGRIVELGSGSCFTPLPSFNVYASSKAFILHYTKALNYELRPYGVRATCFCPGWVDTEFLSIATQTPGVAVPRQTKPLLSVQAVVRRALRAAVRGRSMCVTNWYTKLQHVLFKLLPDSLLTRTWTSMLTTNTEPDVPDAGEEEGHA